MEKPRLRGVWHQWACFAAVPTGVFLGLGADSTRARVGAAVFAGTVVAMFGLSALYHRCPSSPALRRWLRRLDHAGIYGLIAGTYTPFGLLVLQGAWRVTVLAIVWSGAGTAIVVKVLWTEAPEWISAVLGIAIGWVGVVAMPQFHKGIGTVGVLLIVAGGICYTLGAIVYARRRPNPIPHVFGFHELFHALVVAAVALQYAAVARLVL